MRMAKVVIGAGYGDEGKGLMTDALAASSGPAATVVRFNGGAQAGHTVTLASGRRHVFHHLGSGTLAGARTFLSRFFVANPILFGPEIAALKSAGVTPRIMIDPDAPITTPYDMMINQIAERARGGSRHGSCGLGFGETLERHLRPQYRLAAGYLEKNALRSLQTIRREWVPLRLSRLGLWPPNPGDLTLLDDVAILEHWLEDAATFLDAVTIAGTASLSAADAVVFEGAQGLLLDQDRGAFPHVTRSNTGLKNVLTIAAEAGIAHLDVTYVTRCYATRHGAGPLAHELPGPPHPDVIDTTNVPNPWQGPLRFGTLDLSILQRAVAADLSDAAKGAITVSHGLAMTCLDQVGAITACVAHERRIEVPPYTLAAMAARAVAAPTLITCHGPSREACYFAYPRPVRRAG
jgi:adenylosuccinate synthase